MSDKSNTKITFNLIEAVGISFGITIKNYLTRIKALREVNFSIKSY